MAAEAALAADIAAEEARAVAAEADLAHDLTAEAGRPLAAEAGRAGACDGVPEKDEPRAVNGAPEMTPSTARRDRAP